MNDLPPNSPSGALLVSPSDNKNDKVRLKKQLGLLEGVAIILGIIIGSGKSVNLVELILISI